MHARCVSLKCPEWDQFGDVDATLIAQRFGNMPARFLVGNESDCVDTRIHGLSLMFDIFSASLINIKLLGNILECGLAEIFLDASGQIHF